MQNDDQLQIRALAHDDLPALEQHVNFENAHGQARFSANELPAWLPTVDAALLLAAEDAQGNVVGCASASVVARLASSVQINGFCLPGEHEVLRALADAIALWEGAADATELLAHVSSPSREQEEAWINAGFRCVATRARVELVPALAGLPEAALPPGVEIFPLAERPALAGAVLKVWNECHADIPSPLTFKVEDGPAWRADLGIGADDSFPPSLLIAAHEDGEVVGVAFLNVFEESGVGGHRFTGTARSWRGNGIATALKVAVIHWAASNGVMLLRGSNDAANEAIRAVNHRLGYQERFRIVMFQKPMPAGCAQ